MKPKVTIKTDEFEVELPCKMEVWDTFGNSELTNVIYYNAKEERFYDESGFPWAKAGPIRTPKKTPWKIEDFKVGMTIFSKAADINYLITAVDNDDERIFISGRWIGLDSIIKYYCNYSHEDFMKEVD